MSRTAVSLRERFEGKYIPEPNSGCWLWLGAHNEAGYGLIDMRRNKIRTAKTAFARAHRVSYELHKGPIPAGMQICHTCDTPACVNPDHLFTGDHLDNHLDCVKKGRFKSNFENSHGQSHGMAKLTEADVLGIRTSGASLKAAASKYNVSLPLISAIRTGRLWKGVHSHFISEKKHTVRTEKQIEHAAYERARIARKRAEAAKT